MPKKPRTLQFRVARHSDINDKRLDLFVNWNGTWEPILQAGYIEDKAHPLDEADNALRWWLFGHTRPIKEEMEFEIQMHEE